MRKKGSLNLSVNAIVVLILAITMLGLGLGFMKGMFGKVSGKIDAAIDSADLKNPPSLDNPLTISTKTITINRGGSGDIQVAFLNSKKDPVTATLTIDCGTLTATDISYGSARSTGTNEIQAWNVFVNIDKTQGELNDLCTANVNDGTDDFYQDFFVKVP